MQWQLLASRDTSLRKWLGTLAVVLIIVGLTFALTR
jgi:hypothetical protein